MPSARWAVTRPTKKSTNNHESRISGPPPPKAKPRAQCLGLFFWPASPPTPLSSREGAGLLNTKKRRTSFGSFPLLVAVRTGLEPVTPCVTGMYSNQTELTHRRVLSWL